MLSRTVSLSMRPLACFSNPILQSNYVLMSTADANVHHGKHHTNLFHNLNNKPRPAINECRKKIKMEKNRISKSNSITNPLPWQFSPQFHHSIGCSNHRSSTTIVAYEFHFEVLFRVENFSERDLRHQLEFPFAVRKLGISTWLYFSRWSNSTDASVASTILAVIFQDD